MAKAKINKHDSVFATKLRELIKERNTTITAVAEHLGFSRQAVSQYCNGDTQPNVDAILKISEYFNVSCDYLLRGVSSENLSISEELGLSEDSILSLVAYKKNAPQYITAINRLIPAHKLLNVWCGESFMNISGG